MKPYWQIGLLTAEEANRLADKEEIYRFVYCEDYPSEDELNLLNDILREIKELALSKANSYSVSYSDYHQKNDSS